MNKKSVQDSGLVGIGADDYASDYAAGRFLSSPDPGEDVVISGLSGVYPDSNDVHHFAHNLYNKIDMVTEDDRRYVTDHPEIPRRCGKLIDISKFDGGYFGTHFRQCEDMDPELRILLEKTVEAIMDAGINPRELEGTRTGVFVGTCFAESQGEWFKGNVKSPYFGITGMTKNIIPDRVSYFLKLNGPTVVCDTACSSSLYALEQAFKSIRSGLCDQAIVGGANMCLHPMVTLQFNRLGVLSKDGACKCFDATGDGYVRSEAIASIFLQKSKDARRIYCNVIHVKTNNDGFKEQGITFPSKEAQERLLREVYEESQVDPSTMSFVEAHGTGTTVGDPEEVESIDAVFCKNRDRPLLIGSVKSNIGHTEPSSGLCSITKVIIGMENGLIPPNIHFRTPREGCEALQKGRLKVVAEKMPFEDDRGLIGVNSFGFGGGNCHVVTRWNKKVKVNHGRPKDNLPRLVCVSGRQQQSVDHILNYLRDHELDAEYIRLYHQIFSKDMWQHFWRGYIIKPKTVGEIERSTTEYRGAPLPIHLQFTDFKSWTSVANDLFVLPEFAASVQRSHNILSSQGVNLKDIVLSNGLNGHQLDSFSAILGVAALQIGIVDVLKTLGFNFESYSGSGPGQFICAYLEETLELKEIVQCLYIVASRSKGIAADQLVDHYRKIKPQLVDLLSKVLPKCPSRSSSKWLPTTAAPSPLFFVESLCEPAFSGAIPQNRLVVQIGNTGLCSNGLKYSSTVSVQTEGENGFLSLLRLIGRLYEYGHSVDISKLYPPVQYPVSRGTPMISPLIKWRHDRNWYVSKYGVQPNAKDEALKFIFIPNEEASQQLSGHVIDGRFLYPATSYLFMAWSTLAKSNNKMPLDLKVIFENVKLHRATSGSEKTIEFICTLQRFSGNFEIIEKGELVVSGCIKKFEDTASEQVDLIEPQYNKGFSIPLVTKDIYQELRLRGYNYKGLYKGLAEYDFKKSIGKVVWKNDWISFLDTLLQLKILQTDSRFLYIPVEIGRLTIDAPQHIAYIESLGEQPVLPAYLSRNCDVLKCGFVEVRGLIPRSIPRRKPRGFPVLEKHEFVPNITSLPVEQSVRVIVQLILENFRTITVKVLEVLDDDFPEDFQPLSCLISDALDDLPLIRPEITILSKKPLENSSFKVEDTKLVSQTECVLVVGNNLLNNSILLHQAFGALKENGFILSREPLDTQLDETPEIVFLTIHRTDREQLVLLRKRTEFKPPVIIDVSNTDQEFSWLPELKKVNKSDNTIFVISQNDSTNGIMGLVNCLKQESGGNNVRAVFVLDKAPAFDPSLPFYDHLKKNLSINIYKNGQWGTYRHLLLKDSVQVEKEHGYVNTLQKGDLSSLKWLEGPLTCNSNPSDISSDIVHIYYAGLNFRDIMTASGKINADVITKDRTKQECILGIEYVGRSKSGRRLMGMVTAGAMSTMVEAPKRMVWNVPDRWTMEEAATVPCVYATVIYALVVVARIKRGQTILIHAGSGGVGQAAITIALHHGLIVYTTVGSQEKRDFLRKHFPEIKDHHIGNSRDISFVEMVHERTCGRGVDVVLNSLAEEKLLATASCLAQNGIFLEIGKFDMTKNNRLKLMLLRKEASFHGVMLDALFTGSHPMGLAIEECVSNYIDSGIVKPLVRTVFKVDQLEEAFRFMASGKHIGKVVLQIRNEENQEVVVPSVNLIKCLPRYICDREKVHIIIGGLGGFGMELTDWLVLRGCRHIVLTSRAGISSGYQAYRISIWESYGVTVHVSTADVTTVDGCENLIRDSQKLGAIEGIFNLAVVLKDALVENQNKENFKTSFLPKAVATKYLDEASKKLCPGLRSFVVFSSVSCGRGNAGQTNYGMANSVMERICERRKSEGLPATAIQWGAIGEVGLVAQMQEDDGQLEIGGTLQQPINSCLEVMDHLLTQENPVVSSMVVAEKRRGIGGAESIVDAVANILGIKDMKTVSQHATLAEVGMDSMSGVEIKQIMESEYEVYLTPEDMRSMTFARLQEIQDERMKEGEVKVRKDRPVLGFEMIARLISDEATAEIPLVRIKSQVEPGAVAPQVFLLPGVEGAAKSFEVLASNLKAHALCLQYSMDNVPADGVTGTAAKLVEVIRPSLDPYKPFTIVGHSYGGLLALEVISLLEAEGHTGQLILIDGTPYMLKCLLRNSLDISTEAHFQTGLLCQGLSFIVPYDVVMKNKDTILGLSNYEERLKYCSDLLPNDTGYSVTFWTQFSRALYERLTALQTYEPQYERIRTPTRLFKPTVLSVTNLDEDYRATDLVENLLEIRSFEGNHLTILDNVELVSAINQHLAELVDETVVTKSPLVDHLRNPARIEITAPQDVRQM